MRMDGVTMQTGPVSVQTASLYAVWASTLCEWGTSPVVGKLPGDLLIEDLARDVLDLLASRNHHRPLDKLPFASAFAQFHQAVECPNMHVQPIDRRSGLPTCD